MNLATITPLPSLGSPTAWTSRAAILVLGLWTVLLSGSLLRAGFVAQTGFPWSSTILLDGGWRMVQGQAPHVDFHSPIGYAYLLVVSWAMRLFGATPHALAQTGAGFTMVVALASWFLARRRLSLGLNLAAGLFITAHAASITIFGAHESFGIAFGGQYSRVGWALFFLIPLHEFIRPQEHGSRWRVQCEHAVLGCILGLVFGIKATYFGMGVGCVVIARVCAPRGQRLRGLAAMGAGLILAVAGTLWLSGATLGGYLADLTMAKKSFESPLFERLLEVIQELNLLQLALVIACVVCSWRGLRAARAIAGIPVGLGLGAVLVVMGIGISAYNGSEYACPILGMVATVLVAGVARSAHGAGAILAAALLVGVAGGLARPVVTAGMHGRPPVPPSDTVSAGPFHGIDFVSGSTASPDFEHLVPHLTRSPHAILSGAYLLWLREGLALLDRYAAPQAVVATMDVANPFPFARLALSPRGDVIFWHLGRNVSAATAPAPQAFLATVDVVLEPHTSLMAGITAGKMAIYADYLQQHFTAVPVDSVCWKTVWLRHRD